MPCWSIWSPIVSNKPSIGNPRIASTLLLVFLAGAAAGMLGMRYGLHDRLHRVAAASSPHESSRNAVLQDFKTKLDLSPEQTDQIAVVLEDFSHYYESLQDQLDDLRSTGHSRIVQILQPGQREKFEKMMNELAPQLGETKK
jgi:Spy/CpxP family protein refolding chaperone